MTNLKLSSKKEEKQIILNKIKDLNQEQKMKFWIKTLLSAYSTIPEVIKTVDKIIELQASTTSFATDIFNKDKSTINQVEKIIDLSERKAKLVNIHIMTKSIFNLLSQSDSDLIEKKYCFNWTNEELAKEFNISIRTVFRKVDKIIELASQKLKKKNWSLNFLESQVKDEDWLKERFFKQILEYVKVTNLNFYNKSSSESNLGKVG